MVLPWRNRIQGMVSSVGRRGERRRRTNGGEMPALRRIREGGDGWGVLGRRGVLPRPKERTHVVRMM